MIRQASAFAAAVFALFVAAQAQAQSGAPAVTPANCKEPVVPKQPAAKMTSEELNALTKQYQAAVKDGNSRYMQCASDADWGKFQKKVEAYGNKLSAEVATFNKTNGRPQTTPASCTPMKPLDVPLCDLGCAMRSATVVRTASTGMAKPIPCAPLAGSAVD